MMKKFEIDQQNVSFKHNCSLATVGHTISNIKKINMTILWNIGQWHSMGQ